MNFVPGLSMPLSPQDWMKITILGAVVKQSIKAN